MEVVEGRLIPKPAVIEDVVDEAPNVRTFYLRMPEGYPEPKPGQFNELYVMGVGEVPISVSDVTQEGLVAHTVRVAGRVTEVLAEASVGDVIGVRGPYGKGWPLEQAVGKDVLIVAGGIGLAPLRPVIRHIERNRAKYGKLTILYGARAPRHLLYKYELEKYASIPNTELLLSVDKAEGPWEGHVGFVTDLIPKADIDPERTIAMICGPEIMMKFTIKRLYEVGLKDNQIYLSLERRMRCGVGLCGHCQMGPYFVCKHGPVFPHWFIKKYFWVEQI